MNVFKYKGYIGSIETDLVSKCLHGKLLYIMDLVTYEAQTMTELEAEFKKSVTEYLETCKELHKEPQMPFKGSFNVRIGPELHKEVAYKAAMHGVSLNEFIKQAIQQQIYPQ